MSGTGEGTCSRETARRSTSTSRLSLDTQAFRKTSAGRTSTSSAGRKTSATSATARRMRTTRCRPSSRSGSPTGTRSKLSYTLQKAEQDSDRILPDPAAAHCRFVRHGAQPRPGRLGSHAQLRVLGDRRDPGWPRTEVSHRRVHGHGPARRRLAGQYQHGHSERPAVQRHV